ncbi:GNAT family N-acetyltransferase [Limoniibacter endophyticus]|uniref:N-acetyltransferase domain-containing protein n=1 Tax=Limoniibacter endophyticus TaxID=1565040 RepID=A0A8J3DJ80_9HYPH|nr:GNAT family N-acetyltransferase [Limoniibacter endophyticus]GHC72801.1 hypothetical protein GCM10010136_20760 [Limoniibacter endophyticus]
MQEIRLRPALEGDRAALVALEKQVMHDYAVALWGVWKEVDPASIDLSRTFIIVATDEGRADECGCVATRYKSDSVLFIAKLYISPEYQSNGIGALVLETMKARAAEAGVALQLSVLTTNPAYRFYLREGLLEVSRTPERILMEWRGKANSS